MTGRALRKTHRHWMMTTKMARATTSSDDDSEGELEGDGGAAFLSGLGGLKHSASFQSGRDWPPDSEAHYTLASRHSVGRGPGPGWFN